MPANPDARAVILERIRTAIGGERPSPEAARAEHSAIPQDYTRRATRTHEQILALLEDRLRDYDAHVERVPLRDLPDAITRRLLERGQPRMIVPPGLPREMLPPGLAFTEDADLSHAELDGFDGVLTLATLAIAVTGTVVLQAVPGQGRRAPTLIPDYHLCIVGSSDVVETVPEAFARLQTTASLPTTFISGPSATADIEMTRIKGVHGPRVLDVLLIDES